MRQRRTLRELLGDRHRRLVQRFLGNRQIDQAPLLQRRRIVAAREHRHLLGAQRADALHLALDAAQQRMQSERRLDRTDLRRRRRDDVVAGQRQLEAAAEADAVDACDQRDRQQLHEAEELDAVQAAVFTTCVAAALLHALVENVEIGAGREMPQPAADDDRPAAGIPRRLDLFDDGIDEFRPQQIVGPVNHGQHGNIAALLARDQCILGHGMPPSDVRRDETRRLVHCSQNNA